MKPRRVQLSRRKGWRMPENTVSVARPTKWGNPWSILAAREAGYTGSDRSLAEWCVELFSSWIRRAPSSATAYRMGAIQDPPDPTELRGKNLACWCKLDAPCHADVLLELANPSHSEKPHEDR